MENFSIGVAIIVFIILINFGVENILSRATHYKLSRNEWQCEKVVNIDNDITKVECVLYSKKVK